MWVKPGHTPDRPQPPPETGRRLATFARGDDSEMRINLCEFEGHPFVGLRLWSRDDAGGWWPTGKGCSLRLHELPGAIDALRSVLPAAGARDGRRQERGPASAPRKDRPRDDDRPLLDAARTGPKGRPARPPWDAQRPTKFAPAENFDEFAE